MKKTKTNAHTQPKCSERRIIRSTKLVRSSLISDSNPMVACARARNMKRKLFDIECWIHVHILKMDLSFLCAASNTECSRALNRNAKMVKTAPRAAAAANLYVRTRFSGYKKKSSFDPTSWIYCCRAILLHEATFFPPKKLNKRKEYVGEKLIVAYCQLCIWLELNWHELRAYSYVWWAFSAVLSVLCVCGGQNLWPNRYGWGLCSLQHNL